MVGLKCVVVGGAGAVGRQLVKTLTSSGCFVINVDLATNNEADGNVLLSSPVTLPMNLEQASGQARAQGPFDAIFCMAGGWRGGNVTNEAFFTDSLVMWEANVIGALLAASIASNLKSNGLLVLTSAKAALGPTPGMIGYGMAKAATNQLVSSLAAKNSGLPSGVNVIGILPVTLDTPANRTAMPNADWTCWTPLSVLCDQLLGWAFEPITRPPTGSLISVVTIKSETSFIPLE